MINGITTHYNLVIQLSNAIKRFRNYNFHYLIPNL